MSQRTLEEKIAELREQLVRHEQRQIKQQQQQVVRRGPIRHCVGW
jgi:hypothetical protein